MSDASILVIILNYRTPELTLCAAAAALREMQDLRGEVLIIDNDSGDGSFAEISAQAEARGWIAGGRLRVLQSGRNGGFGAGCNIGLNTAFMDGSLPDFYYLLNSDAEPDPGALRILRDFLLDSPGAGMAGSHVRGTDGADHCTAFRFPSAAGEFEMAARTGFISRLLKHAVVPIGIPQSATQVDWTAGASLMIRREMLDAVGGFDETFFLYFEETELCHRAAQAGWRTHYVPASRVVHVGSASTGMKTWARAPRYWFDSRLYYFFKTRGRGYAAAATLARIAGCLIWRLRRLDPRKPQGDPDRFLRDLLAHSLRSLIRRPRPANMETRLTHPVPEEMK
jgi:GT2 family glycosyltransferase